MDLQQINDDNKKTVDGEQDESNLVPQVTKADHRRRLLVRRALEWPTEEQVAGPRPGANCKGIPNFKNFSSPNFKNVLESACKGIRETLLIFLNFVNLLIVFELYKFHEFLNSNSSRDSTKFKIKYDPVFVKMNEK